MRRNRRQCVVRDVELDKRGEEANLWRKVGELVPGQVELLQMHERRKESAGKAVESGCTEVELVPLARKCSLERLHDDSRLGIVGGQAG